MEHARRASVRMGGGRRRRALLIGRFRGGGGYGGRAGIRPDLIGACAARALARLPALPAMVRLE
eukprot:4078633-Alexandrium_andersonii.AAC.1